MSHVLKKGDMVRVRLMGTEDEWCWAVVEIASVDGRSVALNLKGMVHGGGGVIAGMLPLNVDYEAETVTNLFGDEYEMEIRKSAEKAD